jgi:hypothetical protein
MKDDPHADPPTPPEPPAPKRKRPAVARRTDAAFKFQVRDACRNIHHRIRIGNGDGTYLTLEERRQMFQKVCKRFKITLDDLVQIHSELSSSPEEMAILREAAGLPPVPTAQDLVRP